MKEKFFTIIDYLNMRGDLSFEKSDFNAVDALILSQMSYNNIDGLVSQDFSHGIKLSELVKKYNSLDDCEVRNNMGAMINPLTPKLMEAVAATERFGHIKVGGFINKIDEENIEQFCAMTFEIQKGRYVIVFRGTDDTIAGWYEDFNLGYMEEIPSQRDTVDYVRRAMSKYKGNFIFTGHSKGGNLAVKGAMAVEKKNVARLEAVYDFDGPGFYPSVIRTPEFAQIKDKIKAFVPGFCVVGMLFEHDYKITAVSCEADGILQHDPFSWKVMGPDFVKADKIDEKALFFSTSVNDWTARLSAADRKKFVDTFFDVVNASGAKTNYEIEQNKLTCGGKMIARLSELDEQERHDLLRALKVMVKVAKNNIPMISVFDIKHELKEQIKKLRR